jgi:hypothetical protein
MSIHILSTKQPEDEAVSAQDAIRPSVEYNPVLTPLNQEQLANTETQKPFVRYKEKGGTFQRLYPVKEWPCRYTRTYGNTEFQVLSKYELCRSEVTKLAKTENLDKVDTGWQTFFHREVVV